MDVTTALTLPAHKIQVLLADGTVSSVALTEAALARIHATHEALNAFVTVDDDAALDTARAVDQRLEAGKTLPPLAGVPVAIKDNICTRGLLTTCSSQILHDFVPPYDATVIEKLRARGMVIVGKTNLDQFGMGSSTENSFIGPTHNPWNLDYVPGGTSGGSAAAVAARLVPLALGSDTGGSCRQPASFCNVIGFKPTYGRVSRYGLIAYASSLDQIGILAHDALDCAHLLALIAGHDPRDSTASQEAVPEYAATLDQGVAGLRIGLPQEYFTEGLDPAHRDIVMQTADLLVAQGAEIVELSLPFSRHAIPAYYMIAMAEASTNLARFDGVRFGQDGANAADAKAYSKRARALGFGEEVKRRIIMGTFALSAGYRDAWYQKAAQVRNLLIQDYKQAFARCDLIIGPTSPFPPFLIGENSDDPLANYLADAYTVATSLAGLPAVSVPGGFTESGLPVGVQFQALYFQEALLLRAAQTVQAHTDYHRQLPPMV